MADPVRAAVEHRMFSLGLTATSVCRAAQVDTSHFRRWRKGSGTMSTAIAGRLLRSLGLELVPIELLPQPNATSSPDE